MWKEGLLGKARQDPCSFPKPSPPPLDGEFVSQIAAKDPANGTGRLYVRGRIVDEISEHIEVFFFLNCAKLLMDYFIDW